MADAVTSRTKMVFIGNPNNPTGTINRKDEFDRMMEKVPESVLVVLDEAYYEYVSDPDYADSMKYLHSKKNVLILRTFSKIYGLRVSGSAMVSQKGNTGRHEQAERGF
jgi:histidinol-phosphate aminotransferase